jgi:HEAT repeat protein
MGSCLALAMFASEAHPQMPDPGFVTADDRPAAAPTSPESELVLLGDPTASDRVRQNAANALVARSEDDSIRNLLAQAVREPLAGMGSAVFVVKAIAAAPVVSPRLFPAVAERLNFAELDELPRLCEALGNFRTREAAALLVGIAEDPDKADAHASAFLALERLSARDDIAPTAAAWRAWLDQALGLSEPEWRFALVRDLAARTRRLEEQRDASMTRLVDALRKQHLLTPTPERSALIASLMGDEQARVRDLGFELASRELAAGGTPGPEVVNAARALLASAQPGVRAAAADMLRAIAPPSAGETVQRALDREQDPMAAAALLRAASRWPTSKLIPVALHWVKQSPPASDAAMDALWQLSRRAMLPSESRQEVLEHLRSMDPGTWTPSGCSLVAALGGPGERDALVGLLDSGTPDVRLAAAEALVFDPLRRDALVRAAMRDSALFDLAVSALLAGGPTAADFQLMRAFPAPTPEVQLAGALRLARGLPAPDLLIAAQDDGLESALRAQLLGLLVSPERTLSELANPDARHAIGRGVCALANLQIERGELEAAASTIESSPFVARPGEVEGLVQLRIAILVALGRFELIDADAAASDSDLVGPPMPIPPSIVEAWVRGVELAAGRPSAGAAIARLRERFERVLTNAQLARVGAVEAKIASVPDAPGAGSATPR